MNRTVVSGWGLLAAFASAAAVICCSADEGDGAPDGDGTTETPPRDPAASGNSSAPSAPGNPPAPPKFDPDAASPPPPPPPPPKERTIVALDDANTLVRFLVKDPSKVTKLVVSGLSAGETILGLDFRPSNGMLYALGSKSRIYAIDGATGAATPVSDGFAPALAGQSFGFDFNPVADAIRVHSDFNQNLRLSPTTGATLGSDKDLVFAEGDPNFLQDPSIVATAYTNSVAPKPTATVLYGIDSTRDILVKVAPPNDGKVTTVGALGVGSTQVSGFDIWGSADKSEAYAALQVDEAKGASLYKVDLATGKATLAGPIGHPKALRGIAVEP